MEAVVPEYSCFFLAIFNCYAVISVSLFVLGLSLIALCALCAKSSRGTTRYRPEGFEISIFCLATLLMSVTLIPVIPFFCIYQLYCGAKTEAKNDVRRMFSFFRGIF